jgi:cytochrome oxidase Cu insertion factor (SCO1/SenC/PrrC family)
MKYLLQLLMVLIAGNIFGAEPGTATESEKNKPTPAPHCPECEKVSAPLSPGLSTVTPWLLPNLRIKKAKLDYSVTNQAGTNLEFSSLNDRPMAITFLYTRCTNKNKCPLAAAMMAALHEEVAKRNLKDKVRLLVVTYDPEFDTPQRLKRYGEQKGIKFDDCIQMIQPPLDSKDKLFNDMDITVNYSEGMVNIHGIQLVLLDKNARIVRNYHTVIWDNKKVADDLEKLVLE